MKDELFKFAMKDPNVVGEFLRNEIFDQTNGLGCYASFEFNEGFEETFRGNMSLGFLYWWGRPGDVLGDKLKETFITNGEIEAAWYWDGDGYLLIKWEDIFVENADCKNTNYWNFVKFIIV